MSKVALDLKHFKHVKSDDKTTTLKHADGHELTLHHKALAPDMQKQLEALAGATQEPQKMAKGGVAQDYEAESAGGGYTPGGSGMNTYSAGSAASGVRAANSSSVKAPYGATINVVKPEPGNGKVIVKEAEGGEVPDIASSLYSTDPQEAAPALNQAYETGMENAINQKKEMALDRARMEGDQTATPEQAELEATTKVKENQDKESQLRKEQEAEQNTISAKIAKQREQMGLNPSTAAPQQAQAMPPAADMPAGAPPQASAQAPQSSMLGLGSGNLPDPGSLASDMYSHGVKGAELEAQAQAGLGQAEAKVMEDKIQQDQIMNDHFQSSVQSLEKERQAHIADINAGYINPDKYWTGYTLPNGEKVDGHSKVASAIGMIMAGFNPTTNPNAAVNFLKTQMDQSIEAQKTNLNSSHNLLRANLDQFKNVRDAQDMTRIMMNDAMQHKLTMEAAKAKTPMAAAALENAKSNLAKETMPIAMNLQMRQALMKINSDPNAPPGTLSNAVAHMRVINPEAAKEMETRLVPGVGPGGREALATVPVPDSTRKEIIAKQQLSQAMNDMRQWSMQHSGSMNLVEINRGKAMAANVQNLYRDAMNGGVFKQGEQGFISGIVDADPSKFFNSIRVLPKLDEALRANDSSLNTLKKGYGLPISQPASQQMAPVKGKDGKMYVLSPDRKHMIPATSKEK